VRDRRAIFLTRRSRAVIVQNFRRARRRRLGSRSNHQHRTALPDVIGVELLFADEIGLLARLRRDFRVCWESPPPNSFARPLRCGSCVRVDFSPGVFAVLVS
jgi:hypothetical protein